MCAIGCKTADGMEMVEAALDEMVDFLVER
jgi:hypothetical protein